MTTYEEEMAARLLTSQERIIEHFHQLSLSDNKVDQIRGRLGKELGPLMEALLFKEFDRVQSADDAGYLVTALTETATHLMLSSIGAVGDNFNGDTPEIMKSAGEHSAQLTHNVIESIIKDPVTAKST